MGKRAGAMIKEETKVETPPLPVARRWFTYISVALGLAFAADFASALSLYWTLHSTHFSPSVSNLWHSLQDFHTDALDLVVLALLRALLLPGVAYVASRYAWQEETSNYEKSLAAAAKKKAGDSSRSSVLPVSNGGTANGSDLRTPLLNGDGGGASSSEAAPRGSGPAISRGGGSFKKMGEDQSKWEAWLTPKNKKDILLFGSFLLCTVFQVFVGAKCVAFYFQREGLEGPLMGIAVLWINLESTLVGRLVEAYQTKVRARCREAQEKAAQGSGEGARVASALLAGLKGTGQAGSMILMDPVAAARALRETQLRGDKGVRDEADVGQRTYLLRALGLARQEIGTISLGLLCLALTSASGLILPHYQGSILDRVIAFDQAGFRRDVIFLVSFSVATGIFGGIRGLCFSVVGKRVLKTLQDKLFTGIIKQDVAYFDATTSGELTSRLTNDVGSMAEPLNWMISTLLRSLLQLAGGFFLCFFTSWKLSMLAFTTMAPIMHITATYSRWSRELNRKRYALLAEANSAAAEALGNIRTVRAFSTEELELTKYQNKTLAAMTKGVTDAFAYSFAVAINNWLDLGASVLILWYGGVLVMDGHLSIGKLITFQLYWNQIQSGYQTVMQVLMSLTRAAGAAQRVLSLVDALPDIDPNAGTCVSTLQGDMKLEDLHFFYQMRPAQKVLAGINLHVAPGQVCALVGRSGGGKSTIVHLLMRFYDPTAGRILLDGWDLRSLNLRSVHRHMGVVAQDTQMFATSIEENITYGVESYTQEELHECARNANAHDFILQFPDGYATRVGERGVRLSGGQRQRIAIARMLLRKPKILLLDEATSALDSESEAQVQQALDRLIQQGGRTVVLVAHRLSTVKNADTIVVLDKGTVVEQGTHDDLLQKGGVYSKLVQRQLAKERNKIENPDMDGANQASDEIDSLLE